jgi:hypothetical protein
LKLLLLVKVVQDEFKELKHALGLEVESEQDIFVEQAATLALVQHPQHDILRRD